MLAELFRGIFDAEGATVVSVGKFLLCVGVALFIGVILTAAYLFRSRYTRSFVITLSLLPAVVSVIIMMVNGNIGAGVAVAGAFGLVRFRSVPGSAKEIGALFLAMGAGLICGMGYLAYAVVFAVLLSAFGLLLSHLHRGKKNGTGLYKTLRITVPEDLDYEGVFDGILEAYTESYEITAVKTTNMGSLFRLTYDLKMKAPGKEKEMLDQLRMRNGNLELSLSKQETGNGEL